MDAIDALHAQERDEDEAGRPMRSPPCKLVIFGGGGDLTKRLLVPAIYNLVCGGLLNDDFSIVAVDWADLTTEALRQQLDETMRVFVTQRKASAATLQEDAWKWLHQRVSYLR